MCVIHLREPIPYEIEEAPDRTTTDRFRCTAISVNDRYVVVHDHAKDEEADGIWCVPWESIKTIYICDKSPCFKNLRPEGKEGAE